MSEAGPSPRTGHRIGGYELGPLLGTGGMGEVYRARDNRLERDVAIKILPAVFTADPERLARFEREARVLARLNHPHIATIYGVEEAGEERALVLELVDGETLAETIARDLLPLDRLLDIAVALADAIAAAHEKGVTHRDLKPANVMVRPDGRIKVLDFGIAKLRAEVSSAAAGTGTPLTTLTDEGRVLGTAAYMSPEQAAGRLVDHRSDLFSLGAVLYETATGTRAFRGDTTLAQLAAVLTETPAPPTRLRPGLPPGLDAIIGRALEKDPDHRYQTAQQLRDDLIALRHASIQDQRAVPVTRRRRLGWAAALLGAVSLALAAAAALWSRSADSRAAALVSGARQITFDEGIEGTPALSPDGRWLAYERAGDIFLRDLDDGTTRNLTPDSPAFDGEPAFSPDGRRIAFSSRRDGGQVAGGIWLIEAAGGAPKRLTNAGFSPAWSPDGEQVLFATEFVPSDLQPAMRVRISALRAVRVRQGVTRTISEGDVAQPTWSPNGHRIAHWIQFADGRPTRAKVATMRPDGSDIVPVAGEDFTIVWNPVWPPDGRHVYFCGLRDGIIGVWRVGIDEKSGEPQGKAQPVPLPAGVVRHLAVASNGRVLAWEASRDEANVHRIPFDPVAGIVRDAPIAVTSGTRLWLDVDVSTTGRLVMSTGTQPSELWVSDVDGAGLAPLFPKGMPSRNGRWSPDGSRIAFTSIVVPLAETWTVRADGSDVVRVSNFGRDGAGFFPLWSPDGARLAVTTGAMFGGETFLLDPARPWQEQNMEALRPAPGDPSLRYRPWSWSPDGQRIAAYSERGAGIAVYSLALRSWEIITASGTMPRWLADSRRLVYEDGGRLHIIDTATKDTREIHAVPGSTMQAPAVARGDSAIYFVRTRLERDIWIGMLRQD
jgi:serine/threonine protein kinase/Tol biopolymer transport system component